MNGALAFETMHDALRAVAEGTRLRILALLAEAELTVSDLTEILRQSQPRISRHLKLLSEANLIERHREGAWAFFRIAESGDAAGVARMIVERLDPADPVVSRDREVHFGHSRHRPRPKKKSLSPREVSGDLEGYVSRQPLKTPRSDSVQVAALMAQGNLEG
mgnify:CR=1 FL=1